MCVWSRNILMVHVSTSYSTSTSVRPPPLLDSLIQDNLSTEHTGHVCWAHHPRCSSLSSSCAVQRMCGQSCLGKLCMQVQKTDYQIKSLQGNNFRDLIGNATNILIALFSASQQNQSQHALTHDIHPAMSHATHPPEEHNHQWPR